MRRLVISLLVLALIALAFFGDEFYLNLANARAAMAADQQREQQIASNSAQIHNALLAAGVDPHNVSAGFWFITTDAYGNQSIAYFSPDQLAQEGQAITADELAAITAEMKKAEIYSATSMQDVPEDKLPANLQFHDALYTNTTAGTFQNTQTALETAYANHTATAEQLWELSYMYELQGNYAKRDELNAASCTQYKIRCSGELSITVRGTVLDLAGNPIQAATVSVLSDNVTANVTTDAKGTYSFKVSVLPMEKIRISAVKRNYSNGVASVITLSANKTSYTADPIVLGTPINIVTIDTVKHTVTGKADAANSDGSFVLNATSSRYEIPAGAIVHSNGAPYQGPIEVYIYEFTRYTVPASLVNIDTFDQVMGYTGNLMKSFGMPYIQFFTPSGEELDVMKSKPMLLTYHIAGMQDLRNNIDKMPYGKLTDEEMQTLVNASVGEKGFPITANFLVKDDLLTFPPFWVFDRKAGVWDNIGVRVLDTSGTIQMPFYTINDAR